MGKRLRKADLIPEIDRGRRAQEAGKGSGARYLARAIVEGGISASDGAASLGDLFSPYVGDADLSARTQHWRQLDDAYDCEHCRDIVEEAGTPLDEAVVAAAHDVLSMDWRCA
jgi:hypothetical protein